MNSDIKEAADASGGCLGCFCILIGVAACLFAFGLVGRALNFMLDSF